MILRRWRGLIRTAQREEYHAYIAGTGGTDYASTPGNLGWQMLFRDRGDGTTGSCWSGRCMSSIMMWWMGVCFPDRHPRESGGPLAG